MQTSGPEFWWAVGIGSVSLVAIGAAYILSIVFNQRRFISEQQRQLTAIQESEQKYRNLFENSQVGIVRVSLDDFRIWPRNLLIPGVSWGSHRPLRELRQRGRHHAVRR